MIISNIKATNTFEDAPVPLTDFRTLIHLVHQKQQLSLRCFQLIHIHNCILMSIIWFIIIDSLNLSGTCHHIAWRWCWSICPAAQA
jgi:hypothetical protein